MVIYAGLVGIQLAFLNRKSNLGVGYMNSWRYFALGLMISLIGGTTLFFGCTRQIAVPVSPGSYFSPTPTPILPANGVWNLNFNPGGGTQVTVTQSGTNVTVTGNVGGTPFTLSGTVSGNSITLTNGSGTTIAGTLSGTPTSGTTITGTYTATGIPGLTSGTVNGNYVGTPTPTFTITQTLTATQTPIGPTATGTSTFTPSSTSTSTSTATGTSTNTPTGPTATPTDTGTATSTGTPTLTPTVTNSPTQTLTLTSTGTPTQTATATPNPLMIADFEEGQAQDILQLGRDAYWYIVPDGVSTLNFAPTTLVTGGPGGASDHAISVTGSTPGSGSIYAALQGDFVSTKASYNLYTAGGNTANNNATGFVFYIIGSGPGSVWFNVSDQATTASSDNAGYTVPITSSWTAVTVFFDRMQSQGWGAPGHMFDPTTAISFAWKVTSTSSTINFAVDDFQLTTATAPPTWTPTPTPNPALIDDFEGPTSSFSDSVSNIYVYQDSNSNWRDGYWFEFSDVSGSFAAGAGNPGTGLEFTGSMSVAAGLQFNFTNPGTGCAHNCGVSYYDATVGGTYTGIRFDIMAPSLPVTLCSAEAALPLRVDMINNAPVSDWNQTIPLTTSWQAVTVYYDRAKNANGAFMAPADAANMLGVKFVPINNAVPINFDFIIDNVQFVSGADPKPPSAITAKTIDNFEDGDNQALWTDGGSITPGYWYTYAGTSNTGNPSADPGGSIWTICPSAGALGGTFFPSTPGNTAVAGSSNLWAAHVTGTWGDESYPFLGLGLNLAQPRAQVDLSANAGVSFYAKVDPTSVGNVFYVKFPSAYTDPAAGICTDCSNDYGVPFTFTTTWQPYVINFSGSTNYPVQQAYWGCPGNDGGCTSPDFATGTGYTLTKTPLQTIYAIQFQTNGSAATNPGVYYNYSVDDVTFF